MKNQIDKFFVVLGAIALAVFNALIPNIFIKEREEFVSLNQNVNDIAANKATFPYPKYIYKPQDIDNFRNDKTSPMFTAQTSLYEKDLYEGKTPQEAEKKFMKEICNQMPECEVFINYSTPTVTIITPSPQQTQPTQKNIPKCEKPKIEVVSGVGKVEINITPGAASYSTISGFNIFRNDKGDEKPHMVAGADELKKTDDKIEPDKDYKYKAQQICTATEGGQNILSEFSEEQTAQAKRKFYIKCSNFGTTTAAAKVYVQEYKEDGTMIEGTHLIKVKNEIKIPPSKNQSSEISTGLVIISIDKSKKVRHNKTFHPQAIVKYCKLDAQKSEGELEERCEDNSIVEMPCEFDDFKPQKTPEKPPEEKGKDKKNEQKPDEKEPEK